MMGADASAGCTMNNIRSKIFGDGKPIDGHELLKAKSPRGASAARGLHTIAVERQEARSGNTRDNDRHRLTEQAVTVTHRRKKHEAELINLSGGGAMIHANFVPKLWDRIDLHLGENGTIESAVRWIKNDRIGLEFAHETKIDCSREERAQLLTDVIGRSFPDLAIEVAVPAPEQQREDSAARDDHRRGEPRHPLIWSGTAHFNHQSAPVRLRNISATGALIESSLALPEGAEMLLDLNEAGSIFATVSWALGDQAGLRFNDRYDMKQLARAKPELASVNWESPAYLVAGDQGSSAWAKEWGRASLSDLKADLEGYLKH
jgi:hypothetical protein